MRSAENTAGRAATALDRMLQRVPEREPTQPVAANAVMTLRAGHMTPDEAARMHAALAHDSDARHLFASLDAEPDERQLRKAITAALAGPAALPRSARWPWAFGGGGLALIIVIWLGLRAPTAEMPQFVLDTQPSIREGIVRVARGTLTVHARGAPPAATPIRAALFVGQDDGLHLSPIPLEVQPDGSFRASAPVHRWFPGYGRYEVHIAVMPAAHRMAIRGDRLVDRQVGQAGVRWVSQPVLYRPTLPDLPK